MRTDLARIARALGISLAALLAAPACAPPRFALVSERLRPPPVEIRQLHLQWSNTFLLRRGASAVLVDAGSPGDWADLVRALRAEGLAPRDLRLAVLTHGHADHAGLAARLQAAGVPVALGRGDAAMAARGHDDPLRATGLGGVLLRPLVDFPFAPFAPDVLVEAPLALDAYGLQGVRVAPLSGHTPGSLVVWVGERDVIAGDVVLGGLLGGGTSASEHFYQADVRANHCNVERLLAAGARRFYVGHGGPIDRASVLAWRAGWAREVPRCATAQGAAP